MQEQAQREVLSPETMQQQLERPSLVEDRQDEDEDGDEITYQLMKLEVLDEAQIEAEIKGMTTFEECFYTITDKNTGREQIGLSWTGVKELRRVMSEQGRPISISELHVEEKPDRFVATAVAKLMPTGERSPGVSEQPYEMEIWADQKHTHKIKVPDQFARQKAVSKAKRNAIRDFIPELAIKIAYEEWKKGEFPVAKPKQRNVGKGQAKSSLSSQPQRGEPTPSADLPKDIVGLSDSISKLQWYTKADGRTRQWKPEDDWGWCNATTFGGGEFVEFAKPIVAAIENNQGILQLGEEQFSVDYEKGQLLRRRRSGKT